MRKFKKVVCLILALSMIWGVMPSSAVVVSAATSLPSEIYLRQEQSGTCTLSSAAMMLRSRAYLSNNSNWSAITENGIRSKAWMEGVGLYWNWSYSIDDCSFSVDRKGVSGMSVDSLKTLLDSHPEGIVLYCGGVPHAVFLTDYEGDTFYCADPTTIYSGSRIPLASSYLGRKLGSQENILNNMTAYWYIDSYDVPSETGLPFEDIYASDWYYEAVMYVYENGIMTGMTADTFGPISTLSRAQFAVMLYRMEGEPDVEYAAKYPDVTDGLWYTDAVLWASENGIITGYSEGYFGPADDITREQIAVMMYRYAKYKGYDVSQTTTLDTYIDGDYVSAFAREGMEWAVGAGIITGKDNGTRLAPLEDTARAECAVIIQRF